MTVNETTGRPQRRVGTFTLGLVLVVSGIAMLAALFFPAIPPERFLQASPLILVLLGIETLLASRNGGAIKYDWLGMILCFLLTGAALSMYAAAWYFSETGPGVSRITARHAGDASYSASFASFNGFDSHVLHLQSGDVLQAASTIRAGVLELEITDQEGDPLAEHTIIPGSSSWDRLLEIPADGDYWVQIRSDYVTGALHLGTGILEQSASGQP